MISRFWQMAVSCSCSGLILLASSKAIADDDLGVTMRMVTDDDDLTESVVREIELRDPVALERHNGKADEPSGNASEARERGREAARAATERARKARERKDQRGRPDMPERPDASNRPDRPEPPRP